MLVVILALTGTIIITLLTLVAFYSEENEVEEYELMEDSFKRLLMETKRKANV